MLLGEKRAERATFQQTYTAPRRALLRFVPALLLCIMAAIATAAYGQGNIIGEGQADLHIDPLRFLGELRYMWDPRLYLGSHNGFTQVYLTPYGFLYGLFAVLHLPAEISQRAVIFLINLGIAGGMYWALRFIAPGINLYGRLAGASAYLFNIYVAFNTQGSVPMLLPYASLPWIAGALAAAIEGVWPPLFAGAAIALFIFAGSGVNPPLIAINAAILALYPICYALCKRVDGRVFKRFAVTAAGGSVLSLALNLYWIVPFLDYMRTVWMAGVLDESPLMHNADSSFSNVLRGLGQWAIFQTGVGRAYYPWAHAYQVGQIFAFMLWLVPMCGIAVLLFRRKPAPATLFFLSAVLISVPLAVGYYHGPMGSAVTKPVYDYLYTYVPGFQMFRSAYKWVGGYEFGISGLFGLFVWLLSTRDRQWRLSLRNRSVAGAGAALVLLPLLVYVPVILNKANYALLPLPEWMHREGTMAGSAPDTRVAIFPGQFLERFDWGEPNYYVEHALIRKPMFYGYLGAATNESADQWLRLAYRRAREGDPGAENIFRALSVSEILQRDDFRVDQDFAFPDTGTTSNATVAHDVLTRVMGLRQIAHDGANRLYAVPDPLPLVYGVTDARLAPGPAVGVATGSNSARIAAGHAQLTADGMNLAQFRRVLASGVEGSENPAAIDDYATTMLLATSTHVEIQHADQLFALQKGGRYRIVALNVGLDYTYPPAPIVLDRKVLRPPARASGSWQLLGTKYLRSGNHRISSGGAGYLTPVLVAFVNAADWTRLRTGVASALSGHADGYVTVPVKGASARVRIGRTGRYHISASALRDYLPTYRNLALGALAPAPALQDVQSAPPAGELPYVPLSGVTATPPQPLPERWFTDPRTFQWNRGSAVISWRLTDRSRFLVFSAASTAVNAELQMLVAANYPKRITAPLRLNPGANIVNAPCTCTALSIAFVTTPAQHRVTLSPSLALASPSHVTLSLSKGDQSRVSGVFMLRQAQHDRDHADASWDERVTLSLSKGDHSSVSGVRVREIPLGADISVRGNAGAVSIGGVPESLAGDPFVSGYTETLSGRVRVWIAAMISTPGRRFYRVFPVKPSSDFSVALAQALPNSPSDNDARIEGVWLLLSGNGTLGVSSLNETRTALPGHLAAFVGSEAPRASLDVRNASDRIVIPLGTLGRVPADAEYISLGVRNTSSIPQLEYNDGSGWRLVGDVALLTRPSAVVQRGNGVRVYRYDFGSGSGIVDALHRVYANAEDAAPEECCYDGSLPGANRYRVDTASDGSIGAVEIASSVPRAPSFALVSLADDWITRTQRGATVEIPRYAFAAIPPRARLRVTIDPPADAAFEHRGIRIDSPRYVDAAGADSAVPLLIDGRPADAQPLLRRGMHRINAADDRVGLDLLRVGQGRPNAPRRIPMRVQYESPVRTVVTLPSGSPPFLLVLNETYYGAWQAAIGGDALIHARANGFANGWLVPASPKGTQIVIEFRSQRKFWIAVFVSVLALLAIVAIMLRLRPRRSAL